MSASIGLSRRAFLSSVALLGGAGAVVGTSVARAADTTATAWELDPNWGYPRGHHGRTSCRCGACVRHAQNKLFATEADATQLRAHAGCLCVPKAKQISQDAYLTLFAGGLQSVDRRDPAVAAVLNGRAPTPTDHGDPSSANPRPRQPGPAGGGVDERRRGSKPSGGHHVEPLGQGSSSGRGSRRHAAGYAVAGADVSGPQPSTPNRPDRPTAPPADRSRPLQRPAQAGSRIGRPSDVEIGLLGAIGATSLGALLWLRRRNPEPEPVAAQSSLPPR